MSRGYTPKFGLMKRSSIGVLALASLLEMTPVRAQAGTERQEFYAPSSIQWPDARIARREGINGIDIFDGAARLDAGTGHYLSDISTSHGQLFITYGNVIQQDSTLRKGDVFCSIGVLERDRKTMPDAFAEQSAEAVRSAFDLDIAPIPISMENDWLFQISYQGYSGGTLPPRAFIYKFSAWQHESGRHFWLLRRCDSKTLKPAALEAQDALAVFVYREFQMQENKPAVQIRPVPPPVVVTPPASHSSPPPPISTKPAPLPARASPPPPVRINPLPPCANGTFTNGTCQPKIIPPPPAPPVPPPVQVRPQIPIPTDLARRLEEILAADSRGWYVNRYSSNSLRNLRVTQGTLKTDSFRIRGDFSYQNGRNGWIEFRVSSGILDCIEYWDSACRRPRNAPSIDGFAQSAQGNQQLPRKPPARTGRKATEWEHHVACYSSRMLIANFEYKRLKDAGKDTDQAKPLTRRAYRYRFAAIAIAYDSGLRGRQLINRINDAPFGEAEYMGYYDPNRIDQVCIDPNQTLVGRGADIQDEILGPLDF
ncbi:MAG: hypothetical protein R3E02_11675 [Blastomonas sp.]